MSSIFEAYRRPMAAETASCGCNGSGGEAIMDADLFADGTSMESVPESAFYRGGLTYGETNPLLLAAAPAAAGALVNAAANFDPFRIPQSGVNLARSGIGLVRDGIDTGRAAMGAVRDAIDTGYRIVGMANDIRSSYEALAWEGPSSLRLEAAYNPGNLGEQSNVWRFSIACKLRPTDTRTSRFSFRVVVTHNCFSIIRARIEVESVEPNRDPFSESLASVGNWLFNTATAPARAVVNTVTRVAGTHRLTIRSSVDTTQYNNFPYQAAFNLDGIWDPADAGSLREDFSGRIIVRSNGMVEVNIRPSGGLVAVTTARAVSGPSVGACQVQYDGARNRMGAAGQTMTGGAVPGTGSGRSSAYSGGGSGRASQALLPDPPNGKHIFFANSRSGSTGEIEALLREWWAALPIHLQNNLQAGQTVIYVDGHADPTGQESRNRELSDQRARSVAGIVRSLLPGARIVAAGHGSDFARRSGVSGADPAWRRVTVGLDLRR